MKRGGKIALIVIVAVLVVALIGPFLVPVPPLSGLKPIDELADADSKFIEINTVTIHYKEMGQGKPTFILLHGFGASTFSWREVMEPLSHYGRVIAYDRPAFGLTERPMPGDWQALSPYGMDANVELLRGLMDALGVDQAILIGNSAGGGVAAEFALRHPMRVQALILVDPAVSGGSRFPAWAAPLLASPQLRHLGPLLVRSIADSGNDTVRLAWHDPSKVTDEILAGYRRPLQVQNWDRALYEFTIAARPSDLSQRMDGVSAPMLILTGDDDRIIPTEQTVQLAKQLPSAELAVLPGCGHVPQEECPQAFLDAVLAFFKNLYR